MRLKQYTAPVNSFLKYSLSVHFDSMTQGYISVEYKTYSYVFLGLGEQMHCDTTIIALDTADAVISNGSIEAEPKPLYQSALTCLMV